MIGSRVLFIGLDGATYTVLDPLMRDGTMPFLRDFIAGGARAVLRSTPQPLTPPAWTSIMTGTMHRRGIQGNPASPPELLELSEVPGYSWSGIAELFAGLGGFRCSR